MIINMILIMVFGNELKGMILETYDSNRIKEAALRENMVTLRQDGIQKVLAGTTTVEEVLRVTEI